LKELQNPSDAPAKLQEFRSLLEIDRAAAVWPVLSVNTRRRVEAYTSELLLSIESAQAMIATDEDVATGDASLGVEIFALASIDALELNERRWSEHRAVIGASLFAEQTGPQRVRPKKVLQSSVDRLLRTPLQRLGYTEGPNP
jgi:hypothetical protein